jgi:hypothetical protein
MVVSPLREHTAKPTISLVNQIACVGIIDFRTEILSFANERAVVIEVGRQKIDRAVDTCRRNLLNRARVVLKRAQGT